MKLLRMFVLVGITISSAVSRHVYPFRYIGAMPDMVRMVDDPRQVGVDEALIEPPRYVAKQRDLKTHDFYSHDPQDSTDVNYPADKGIRDQEDHRGYPAPAVIPTGTDNAVPQATLHQYPGPEYPQNQYIPAIFPQFQLGNVAPRQSHRQVLSRTGTQLVYPQHQLHSKLQCFSVGSLRNEAMDAWCVINCNHTPSFCPLSHCACSAYEKK